MSSRAHEAGDECGGHRAIGSIIRARGVARDALRRHEIQATAHMREPALSPRPVYAAGPMPSSRRDQRCGPDGASFASDTEDEARRSRRARKERRLDERQTGEPVDDGPPRRPRIRITARALGSVVRIAAGAGLEGTRSLGGGAMCATMRARQFGSAYGTMGCKRLTLNRQSSSAQRSSYEARGEGRAHHRRRQRHGSE